MRAANLTTFYFFLYTKNLLSVYFIVCALLCIVNNYNLDINF